MDLEHEGVEVDAPLARHRVDVEEQVHDHRFAAPDAAEYLEPDRRRGGLGGAVESDA